MARKKASKLEQIAERAWRESKGSTRTEWEEISTTAPAGDYSAYHRIWRERMIRFAIRFAVGLKAEGIDPTKPAP